MVLTSLAIASIFQYNARFRNGSRSRIAPFLTCSGSAHNKGSDFIIV
ncbi:MAG: hypothetical protein F6K32_13590 [Desertifilum sp. SIO1I2]|nr:hypothetical protein [Desertifilum sp. SIO1I2]